MFCPFRLVSAYLNKVATSKIPGYGSSFAEFARIVAARYHSAGCKDRQCNGNVHWRPMHYR